MDTNLLLDILNAEARATQFALEMSKVSLFEVSEFSAMVLLASAKDASEYAEGAAFVSRNIVHSLTARIVRRARKWLSAITASSPITADDATVAATAIEHSLPLYTLDPPRFANLTGVATIQPY